MTNKSIQQLKDELSTAEVIREDAIKDLHKAHYSFEKACAKLHYLKGLIEQYDN